MSRATKRALELLEALKVKKAPVPVEEIADHLGAKLSYEPLEGDLSGVLYRDDSRTVIGVNSAHANTRQRFTIAHELGHLSLHKGKLFVDKAVRINLRNTRSSLAEDKEEIEANSFAAELLMPQDLVEKELQKRFGNKADVPDEVVIQELADAFEVSIIAMEYRLKNLGILIPAIGMF